MSEGNFPRRWQALIAALFVAAVAATEPLCPAEPRMSFPPPPDPVVGPSPSSG